MLRRYIGKPITINSGYRTPSYNKAIGGAKQSQHMEGTAVDIVVKDYTPEEVAHLGKLLGFRGIGLYNTFCHLDVRHDGAYWDNRK